MVQILFLLLQRMKLIYVFIHTADVDVKRSNVCGVRHEKRFD